MAEHMRKFKSVLTVVLFVLVLTGCGLKVDPSLELGVRLGLGETCLENHNYQQAENEFKAALNVLEKDPEHLKSDEAEVWTRLGQTYKRLGKHDSAKAALQKGCELYEEADDMFLFTMDKRSGRSVSRNTSLISKRMERRTKLKRWAIR